jgi:hypothetical protein
MKNGQGKGMVSTMNVARRWSAVLVLLSGLVGMTTLHAEAAPAAAQSKTGSRDIGILFNVPSLLMEIESYQGGLGFKIGQGSWAYRGGVDVMFNSSAHSASVGGNLAVEYHLISGPVSPYIGAAVSAGFAYQQDVTSMIPLSVGAIAGAEVFIFDFLSVYAEYTLAFDATFVQDASSNSWTTSYLLDSRLGNSSRLGIVVYFMRAKGGR